MSEILKNSSLRKQQLKALILKLHEGQSPEQVRQELVSTLQRIPYGEVVEVEQELISEGLPESEVLRLCDIHGEVLQGHVDQSAAKTIPDGHPVDVFIQENKVLRKTVQKALDLLHSLGKVPGGNFENYRNVLLSCFNELMDVDKHYQRKEYLVFPYLEKNEITGPPKVMWGKHDEIRDQLRGCLTLLKEPGLTNQDLSDALDMLYLPALKAITDMTRKEEEILFPMCMDVLTTDDWWHVHEQTLDFGFTLYDPEVEWEPEGYTKKATDESLSISGEGVVRLPSGSFTAEEIMAILNTIPADMTFVDQHDRVKYFTQGAERIFPRSRSIINRDVRLCHPPGSVHIVEKILDDFKSGRASHAPFWIQMKDRFILIEYYALRDAKGHYLGTLEFSQDLTGARSLEGERRILSYSDQKA